MGDETASGTKPESDLDSHMLAKMAGSLERRLGCSCDATRQPAAWLPKMCPGCTPPRLKAIRRYSIYTNGAVGGTGGKNQDTMGNDSLDGLLDTVKAMNQPSMLNTFFYVQTRKCAEAMLAHSEGEERQMQMGG